MTGVAGKRPFDVRCVGVESGGSALSSNNIQDNGSVWRGTANWNDPYESLRRKRWKKK